MKIKNKQILFICFMSLALAAQGAIWPFNKKAKVWLNKARGQYAAQDYEGAIESLEMFLERGTVKRREKRGYLLLGQCYEQLGRPEYALAAYLQGVELYPKYEALLLQLASLYQRTGLTQRGIEFYHRVLALNSDDKEAMLGLAESYAEEGFFSRSAEYYGRYFKSASMDDPVKLREYAAVYFNQRMYDAAFFYTALSLKGDGKNAETWFLSAKINRALGNKEESCANLAEAELYASAEIKDELLFTKALWLADDGDYKKAFALAGGQGHEPLALFIKYYSLYKQGREKEGLKYLRQITVIVNDGFIYNISAAILNKNK